MNFRNNSQIKSINDAMDEIDKSLKVLENPHASLKEIENANKDIINALNLFSDNMDDVNRKWLEVEVVKEIDTRVAALVSRFNAASESILINKGIELTLDEPKLKRDWTRMDVKSSNEAEIANNTEVQKGFVKYRVGAVVKNLATLVVIGSLIAGTVVNSVRYHKANDQLKNATAQVQELQNERTDLFNGNSSLEKENAGLREENAGLREENSGLNKTIAENVVTIAANNEEIERLNNLINEGSGQDITELLVQIESLRSDNEILQGQIDALNTTNAEQAETIAGLIAKNDLLTKRNEELDALNESLAQQNTALGNQISALNETITSLKTTIDNQVIQIGNLTAEKEGLAKQVAELEELLKNAGSDEALKAEIDRLKGQISDLQTQLSNKTRDYNNLLTQYGEAIAQKDAALTSYNELVKSIDNSYAEVFGNDGSGLSTNEKLEGIVYRALNSLNQGGGLDAESLKNMKNILANRLGYSSEALASMSDEQIIVAFWQEFTELGFLTPEPGVELDNGSNESESENGGNTQTPESGEEDGVRPPDGVTEPGMNP